MGELIILDAYAGHDDLNITPQPTWAFHKHTSYQVP